MPETPEHSRFDAHRYVTDDVASRLGRDTETLTSDARAFQGAPDVALPSHPVRNESASYQPKVSVSESGISSGSAVAYEDGSDFAVSQVGLGYEGREFSERSVDATGSEYNHQNISQSDTALSLPQEVSYRTSFQADEPEGVFPSEGFEGYRNRASEGAAAQTPPLQDDGKTHSYSAPAKRTVPTHRAGKAYAAATALRNAERAEKASPSSPGVAGGAAEAEEALTDAAGGAVVKEYFGDAFTVDKVTDWSSEFASVGDAETDFVAAAGIGTRAKKAAGSLAKSAAAGALAAPLGDTDDDTPEGDVVSAAPDNLKKAGKAIKGKYSKAHAAERTGYGAAQANARHATSSTAAQTAAKKEASKGVVGRIAERVKASSSPAASVAKSGPWKTIALGGGVIVLLMMMLTLMFTCMASSQEQGNLAYVQWAVAVANNDKYGYNMDTYAGSAAQKGSPSTPAVGAGRNSSEYKDEIYGTDGNTGWCDYDCSSLVYYSLLNSGWTREELGGSWPFTTYNMIGILENAGFVHQEYKLGMTLQKGDILVKNSDGINHTAIYIGDNQIVHASGNGNGGYGDKVGDQTGREIVVQPFYALWDDVLHCTRAAASGNIPEGLGRQKTYMSWQSVTAYPSNQMSFKLATGMPFDSEGFGRVDGRYVIACTTTYGQVGDYVDFTHEDGTVLHCVIGDIKNPNDSEGNEWGHNNGQCIIEFVVDQNTWYTNGVGTHANPGTATCHPEWNQCVVGYANVGHYDF